MNMRRVILVGIAILCVSLLSFVSVIPLERKAVSPDGTITRAAAARPTQVEVTNFPAIQPVSGMINVANFPAAQTVTGSVSVSNLSFDDGGRLRIVGSFEPAPRFVFSKVADLVNVGGNLHPLVGPFSTGGWKYVTFLIRATFTPGPSSCVNIGIDHGGDGIFLGFNSYQVCFDGNPVTYRILRYELIAPEMQIRLDGSPDTDAIFEIWAYLAN
jgi:hypothetical protein